MLICRPILNLKARRVSNWVNHLIIRTIHDQTTNICLGRISFNVNKHQGVGNISKEKQIMSESPSENQLDF